MAFLAPILPALAGSGLLGVGGLLGKEVLSGKKRKPIVQREVTRDADREAIDQADALRRRKGAAADLITGTRGAEAAAGSIGRLVVGA